MKTRWIINNTNIRIMYHWYETIKILAPVIHVIENHEINTRKKKCEIQQSSTIYTTKGRDRLHWAATPRKPYKVGNICYMHMTYRYSVWYFLNLSLKHFFPTKNGNFCENIQIRRPLSFRVLTCRACPIDVLPNRR